LDLKWAVCHAFNLEMFPKITMFMAKLLGQPVLFMGLFENKCVSDIQQT
jgi:hypothetical protein